MLILAIESSCDETAAALVEDGVRHLASVIASSKELHEKTGGIVPEIAARKQVEFVVPVIEETLNKAQQALGVASREEVINKIDCLAVTVGPGLIGSLLVGVEAAKALSVAWNKPLIPVNHLVGHIYGNYVDQPKAIEFPAVVLVVSGGHTDLVLMKNHGDMAYLGGTLDDAAGEAFDKVARLLGLGDYLGGPLLSKTAATCTHNELLGRLPRSKIHDPDFDFSFSGLKTAVRRLVETETHPIESVACEFENAVMDVLVTKTMAAIKKHNVKSLLLAGGVAANTQLRTRLKNDAEDIGVAMYVPPINLCTDNAVYIASAAYFNPVKKALNEIIANPSLGVMDTL